MAIDWTYWPSDPYYSNSSFWDIRPPWVRPMRPGTIRWALKLVTPPASEPIDLATAKLHLRVDHTADDAYIPNLISAAREFCEVRSGLSFLTQTWQLYLDRWPRMDRQEQWPWMGFPLGAMLLPRFPVQSVTSVTWQGSDGSNNTVASTEYVVDLVRRPPRITPAFNKNWPSPTLVPQAGIQAQFVAGYTSAASVPFNYRQAMLLLIGHWYENREEVVVGPRAVSIDVVHQATELLGMALPPMVG